MPKMPLILLAGTLCDATLFEHQVTHLVDVAVPQVVAVHLQDTLADVARYVLRMVEGQFAVAGLSYGGIVALEIWRQAPERVAKLALLNTNPYEASPASRQSQLDFISQAHLRDFRTVVTDFLENLTLYPEAERDQFLRDKVLSMAETIGLQGFVNQIKAQVERPSALVDLPKISCPTLVLCGREDLVVPVFAHEQTHSLLLHSQLVIVEQCGHLSTIEQPEIVTNVLRDWLSGTGIWQRENNESE